MLRVSDPAHGHPVENYRVVAGFAASGLVRVSWQGNNPMALPAVRLIFQRQEQSKHPTKAQMKSVMRNLRIYSARRSNTYQTYQARCLTPNSAAGQMVGCLNGIKTGNGPRHSTPLIRRFAGNMRMRPAQRRQNYKKAGLVDPSPALKT